ncbi:peptidoglycan DD-metalloendopeptidase family protein [Aquimarina sp. ERC-38]|uniref:peptidoglycan DD-metalloendopeptidase family protein n=1 Tax=Aquimarina sp. ERC-38 TaxID=2949996 RepID=UPI002247DC08|nr:peptidoglycan DD-metalloendopeptidase family protein [Aquimarina sp. ERC-38]UZO79298.1 peptidoglycan DD-metalloendopeptidase family protein [Aquimarina sp. ERC-38]
MNSIFPILLPEYPLHQQYVEIDLSQSNVALKQIDITSAIAMDTFIANFLTEHKASVAYGGYLEKRAIYDRSQVFKNKGTTPRRNIHLGVDFWCKAGTLIATPFDASVHSFKNNNKLGDYGPTIILEHKLNNTTFYTLYGHLSLASIEQIEVGQRLKKGTVFCALGDHSVNGDYAPHLHYQVIKDIGVHSGDYPGVCSSATLATYKNNCPNPLSFPGL